MNPGNAYEYPSLPQPCRLTEALAQTCWLGQVKRNMIKQTLLAMFKLRYSGIVAERFRESRHCEMLSDILTYVP